MYMYVCMYLYTYVYSYVCMYVYTYVCTFVCTYVNNTYVCIRTRCVLTNPPIPSSPCHHVGNLRPNLFLNYERGNTRVSPCNE